jgi:penicillin-binding protein A
MNAPLRRAGVVIMILFGLLFVNLNVIQFIRSERYRTDQTNNSVRLQQDAYDRQRGEIVVDGQSAAESVATQDSLKYLRRYPLGPAFAPVVGYRPVVLGATGVERMENAFLDGNDESFTIDRVFEAFTGKEAKGGNVLLTIRKSVQEAAYSGLLHNTTDSKVGAVVALDPTTGAILAMVSTPSYDPNPLASHDPDTAQAAYNRVNLAPNEPLLNRAVANAYPPGSTFKTVVAAAALTDGGLNPDTVLTGGDSYTAPGTTVPIHNSPGVVCPQQIKLQDALRVSCNTAFARLGVEKVGAQNLKNMAQAFGFENAPVLMGDPDNAMNVVASNTGAIQNPDHSDDLAALAQSCIGQREVKMSPLQGALIAATVANDGTEMRPYVIDALQKADLTPVDGGKTVPKIKATPITPQVSGEMRQMMDAVVAEGTGTRAQIQGYEVGGKTGTAQNGDNPDHGWFIGYARSNNGQPLVAVAVFIQNAGPGGSSQATAIGGQVMQAAIEAGKVK